MRRIACTYSKPTTSIDDLFVRILLFFLRLLELFLKIWQIIFSFWSSKHKAAQQYLSFVCIAIGL